MSKIYSAYEQKKAARSKTYGKGKKKSNKKKGSLGKEVGNIRRCQFCKSFMKLSNICAVGNKTTSNLVCLRFVLRPGMDEEYKNYLLEMRQELRDKKENKKCTTVKNVKK